MEEITLFFLGRQVTLSSTHLAQLRPFISSDQVNCLRLPSSLELFTPDMKVLHACLYYVLVVDRQLWEVQAQAPFKQRCLEAIQQHYMVNSMNFELYNYGYLCKTILSLPLQQCLHSLYHLLYSRLASQPYIQQLISQQPAPRLSTHRAKTTKTIKEPSVHQVMSRLNFLPDMNEDARDFHKELKESLRPPLAIKKTTKKTQRKVVHQHKTSADIVKLGRQQNCSPTGSPVRNTTIPVKVGPNAHSSVIQRIKAGEKIVQSQQTKMRRQKFKQGFDAWHRYSCVTGAGGELNFSVQHEKSRVEVHNKEKGLMKLSLGKFKDIANQVKVKNEGFDSIRNSCEDRRHKKFKLRMGNQSLVDLRPKMAAGGLLYNKIAKKNKPQMLDTVEQQQLRMTAIDVSQIENDYGKQVQLDTTRTQSTEMNSHKMWAVNGITRDHNSRKSTPNLHGEPFSFIKPKAQNKAKVRHYKGELKAFQKRRMGLTYQLE